jgi:hypothetical protein
MVRIGIALLISSALLVAGTTAKAVTLFTANLTGLQEVPPNASTASGFATFELNDAMTAFSFNVTVFGLDFTGSQTPATADNLIAAHIHAPAPPGVIAGVVFGFFGTPFNDTDLDTVVTPFATGVGGTVFSEWDASEGNNTTLTAQISNILAGLSYINFHTVQFPGGEIRGQILQVAEPPALIVFGTALLGLIGFHWLRRRRTHPARVTF